MCTRFNQCFLNRKFDQKEAEDIKKTFHVNKKRILSKYNRIIFLLNLPSLSIILSLFIIVLIFFVFNHGDVNIPDVIYRSIFYGTYYCVAYSFIVCLIASIVSDILLKAHSEHTYIEISDSQLVISQHYQTVFTDGKMTSYKKLWIIDLKELQSIECVKDHIIIHAPARYFNERADWLRYESTDNGIDFDNWWYDSNCGKKVQTVEITDYYTYGERIAQRIEYCSAKVIDREARREQFRREMLEIAKSTKHKRGISDKYKPKFRTFR